MPCVRHLPRWVVPSDDHHQSPGSDRASTFHLGRNASRAYRTVPAWPTGDNCSRAASARAQSGFGEEEHSHGNPRAVSIVILFSPGPLHGAPLNKKTDFNAKSCMALDRETSPSAWTRIACFFFEGTKKETKDRQALGWYKVRPS